MNKDIVILTVNLLKNIPSDLSGKKETIIDLLNYTLLSDIPITDYVERPIGKAPVLDKCSISSMARFLQDFRNVIGEFDSSQTGMMFAIEYVNALQNFAEETKAEEVIVGEIKELLKTLKK